MVTFSQHGFSKKKKNHFEQSYKVVYIQRLYFQKFLTRDCMEKKQRIITDQNCGSETRSKD